MTQPNIQTPQPTPVPAKGKIKTIDSLKTFVVAAVIMGPFSLPLLWRNPRFKWPLKVAGSVIVLVSTWFFLRFAGQLAEHQLKQFEALKAQIEQARQQQ